MPSIFNTVRAALYVTVLVFTVICLAMAAHFQTVLAASDLTRFVPFAIFVCAASLFIFTILLLFSILLRERNPISTRIELACLGLAGVFWLVLGVYLTTSDSQSADVECFSNDSQVVLAPDAASFRTEQYQAMYRVLNAFALMNAALVIFACLALLFLALRRHRNGEQHMWHGPVTSCAWFNTYGSAKLGHRAQQSSTSILPFAKEHKAEVPAASQNQWTPQPTRHKSRGSRREQQVSEQPSRSRGHGSGRRSHSRGPDSAPSPPSKKPNRQDSGRSGRSSRSRAPRALEEEIESGFMLHPNDLKRHR
ncbi:hypothetical protein AGABI2DRAFT_191880 [Agaricus bisporus var. bisporus H97]|uniref:hypothetical protein n=1 Tax=Agaricus bisporus var. bisporus (strain H97 / ATCC MYA-4626 / FGSC 10389) TaxID=936046 RepID=UPI00029F5B3A|nr:hypothetical protein AGABI2DRAFT_191880 [Agaricus bisporus var. bisporus H97]EKV48248.1 hypothetical protein AGABI2DRAFT_191880 [Agaricus bisporus var. bisporus H97]